MKFFENNNSAVIRRLTIKTMKANKLRNIFAIVAIALTTLLFTSIFTIGIGIIESVEQETIHLSGSYAHAAFKQLSQDELNKIKVHPLIKDFGYSIMVSMGENKEFLKHHVVIQYGTDKMAEMNFSYPTTGKMPQKENEIVTSTKVLDLLGIPHEIGKIIKIDYDVIGEKRSKELELSGYYESDIVSNVSMIWVSKSFIDKELSNIDLNNKELTSQGTGDITLDVMFENSIAIKENVARILNDCGYSSNEGAQNYVAIGINWAYVYTSSNDQIIMPMLGICLLIILTGYLIIYNIFQISIIKDIRLYGLLKTIGTTPKQIKKLIRNEAFLLSLIGVPIGLVLGFIIGNILLPIIMSLTTTKKSYTPFNPIIFIGSSLFSLITVYISCKIPGMIAASISPIEAAKYNEVKMKIRKKVKKSIDGAKVYKMAIYNILRNKIKIIIVVVSMSLSLILLNSVYTFINSFDKDKFLSKLVVSDFVVGHVNYFNGQKEFENSDVVSEELINCINNIDYIEGEGRVFFDVGHDKIIFNNIERTAQIYGLEDFPISQLKVVEGNIDLEKLKSGNYILENVDRDDYGNYNYKNAPYDIGERVTLKLQNSEYKEYEIMAKIEMKGGMLIRCYSYDEDESDTLIYDENERYVLPQMILPSDEFCNIVKKPLTMTYMFNVNDDKLDEAEKFIKNYTNNIEDNMNYESKQVYIDSFKGIKNMFLLVGGFLSIIIGVIGILNFINSILTSIISRQREFAMLHSIGMTTKQLKNMLMFEGIFYGIATILVSSIIGAIVSVEIVAPITSSIWFCKYKFLMLPLLISAPILLLFGVTIPIISYKATSKKSVVERLRELE